MSRKGSEVSLAGILRRSSTGDDDAQAARATCILGLDSAWSAALMRLEMSMQQTVTGREPGGDSRHIALTSKQVAYGRQ
ncbi:MAG: hypothetical protein QOD88_470 [Mycobacterium sp.]|nr:hypothetical protein [Mycobacterium sp.]